MARLSRVISKNKGDGEREREGEEKTDLVSRKNNREREREIKSKWESNPRRERNDGEKRLEGRTGGGGNARVATRFLFRGRSWHLESSRGLPRCKHLACVVT